MGDAAGEHAGVGALRAPMLDAPADRGFDDILLLAAQACAAPIAQVDRVDADRRDDLCRLVVEARAPVVIPDLTADPRTAADPLVTGDPAIRFYAGTPLVATGGAVLGALCVIDLVARPAGLTATQASALAALARLAVDAMEARRVAHDHDRAVEANAATDARWCALFQQLHEGFVIATVIRDAGGRPVDWRYDLVNRAWSDLIGLDGAAVVGRTVRAVLPGIEEDWIALASVVDTGETVRFTRQVGQLDRWYEGTAQPIGGDNFTVTFVEVTDRMGADARQRALLETGDILRDCATVDAMTAHTAEIVGRALGACRAGYGIVDDGLETIDIGQDWTADGVPSIAGPHRFEDYGTVRDDMLRGEPVIVDDVDRDPRTAGKAPAFHDMAIRAMVNMTVREQGRPVGVFIVHAAAPRRWTTDELAFVRNVADRLEAGIARLRAEEQQALLNGEIAHRLKNSLAMVQAIANRTLRGAADPERLETFHSRLRALGTAHDLLLGQSVRFADLGEVVTRAMEGAGAGGRYAAHGPALAVGVRATLSTSLLIHELATNAMKYGALSADGTVEIAWRCDEATDGDCILDWIERGGPPATIPTRKGFGSRLLDQGLVGTGGADLRYTADGFRARFTASKELLAQS